MIKLRISGNVKVVGASSEEEARAAVAAVASGTEIEAVTKMGPDESPVYMVNLKSEFVELERGEIEETGASPEGEKPEFKEVKDEQSEEAK